MKALSLVIGAAEARLDSWVNQMTGAGTARDKTQYGAFLQKERISDPELAALFYSNAIAKKVVRTAPRMIHRAGYDFSVTLEGKPDDEAKAAILAEADRLCLDGRLYDAIIWGRLYGGGAVFKVTADADQSKPMRDGAKIIALTSFDRRYLRVVSRYARVSDPNFGKPEIYEILPEPMLYQGGPAAQSNKSVDQPGARIHESRIIPCYGDEVDRAELAYVEQWSYSVLQSLYDNLRNGDSSVGSLGSMLVEASTSVFKILGLDAALAGNGKERVMRRMGISDLAKSVYRSVLLDAEKESYERVAVQFGGVADSVTVVMQHVAAAAEMPMTVLFGTSPAGLNATGDSDMRNWYDRVSEERSDNYDPRRKSLLEAIAGSLGIEGAAIEVVSGALWQMTDKEKADLRTATAAADKVYVDMLAVEPESFGLARYRSGIFDPDGVVSVDVKRLERALKPQAAAAPSVQLAPTAYESVLTKRMVLEMLGQSLELPDGSPVPDLDLTITEAKAKAATAGEVAGDPIGALPAAPALPSSPVI